MRPSLQATVARETRRGVGRAGKTVLQSKLERLALSIGRIGFAAGLSCTAGLWSGHQFTTYMFGQVTNSPHICLVR